MTEHKKWCLSEARPDESDNPIIWQPAAQPSLTCIMISDQ